MTDGGPLRDVPDDILRWLRTAKPGELAPDFAMDYLRRQIETTKAVTAPSREDR